MATPTTALQAQDLVRNSEKVVVRGHGTKPALCRSEGTPLDLAGLTGIVEYTPGEYTITARCGTPLSEICAVLDAQGQYMPFDPPRSEAGATLGGAVAAGLNGPGRYRYGGLRDFILGVVFVDGLGQIVHGGGKVVKNAAGFDLPKLVVGSLGMFGAIVEITFKVFPKPKGCLTVHHSFENMGAAAQALIRAMASSTDIDAFEIQPGHDSVEAWVRLRGIPRALSDRAERICALLGGGRILDGDLIPGSPFDTTSWGTFADGLVAKIPVTPGRLAEIETSMASFMPGSLRRYSGGNQLWLAGTAAPSGLDGKLLELGLQGLVVAGETDNIRLGARPGAEFERRIKRALDPSGKFPAY